MRTPRVCVRPYSFKNRERERLVNIRDLDLRPEFVCSGMGFCGMENQLFAFMLRCRVEENEENWSIFYFTMCTRKSENITKTLFSSFCVCVTGPNQYFTEKKHALFLINVFRREQSALHKGIKELFLMSKLIKSVSLSFERHELIDFEQITSLSRKTIFSGVENLNSSKLRLEGALKLWPSSNWPYHFIESSVWALNSRDTSFKTIRSLDVKMMKC